MAKHAFHMDGGETHHGGSRRKDHKASHHGHKQFGKSGGGHGGLHTKLIASPMSPKMEAVHKSLHHAGKKMK